MDWNKDIEPVGPIGLLIESVAWHGHRWDLRIYAAARARTRAEWYRETSNTMTKEALEFDRELCQVSNVLGEVEKGMVATSMMGGSQAKC